MGPVDGPNYYPYNNDATYIENVDTSLVSCILSKITACIDTSDYLRVVKFDFTGTSCTEISWLYGGDDSECTDNAGI